MPDKHLADLIDRYFAGELDPSLAGQVRDFLQATPERRAFMAGVLASARGEYIAPRPSADVLLERFEGRFERECPDGQPPVRRPASWNARRRRTIAPQRLVPWAVALAVGVALVVVQAKSPRDVPAAHSYATGSGEVRTVTLRDGTRVRLAPNSRLVTTADFGRHDRNVQFTGEAYFDVASSGQTPFMVTSGQVVTRVLGTSFDVLYDAAAKRVRVAVVSGKVSVRNRSAPMTLTAGMVGHLTDSTMSAASVGDIAPYITWTRGQLVFDHVPVSEMLTTLGRWYGYDFHLTDSTIATRRVTTSFRTTTPEEVMPMLQDLLNVSASVDGPVITLRPVTKPSRRIPAPARRESRDPYSPLTEVGR